MTDPGRPALSARRLVSAYLRPRAGRCWTLLALIVTSSALSVTNPLLAARFVDRAIEHAEVAELLSLAAGYLAVALAALFVGLAAGRTALILSQDVTNDLRVDLAAHVLDLDSDYLAHHSVGELLERVEGDSANLEPLFATYLFEIVATGMVSMGVLVVSMLANIWLGLILLVVGCFGVAAVHLAHGASRRVLRAERRARSELTGFVEQRLAMREDIRSTGAENFTLEQVETPLARLRTTMTRAGAGTRAPSSALELGVTLAVCAVLAGGGALLGVGRATLPVIFLIYQYVTILSGALFKLSVRLGDVVSSTGSLDRVVEFLSLPTRDRSATGVLPPTGAQELSLSGVSFGYEVDELILRSVDVTVPAGTSLAVVGRTGSGKTTICRLLSRAYEPTAGVIRYGGTPLNALDAAAWRGLLGVVGQRVHLFDATVRENVAIFDDRLSDQQVLAALVAVGLEDWLDDLPDGLQTRLGGSGPQVSLGQLHLLGMARVIVQDPAVVLVDEVTAHLDPAAERLVCAALAQLVRHRTAVTITHSRSVLDVADQVLVLADGVVEWCGPRSQMPAEAEQGLLKDPAA